MNKSREIAEKLAHDLDLDERLSVRLYNTAVIWFTTALEEREREGYERGIEDSINAYENSWTIKDADIWARHELYHSGKCSCVSHYDKAVAAIRELAHKARGEKGDE